MVGSQQYEGHEENEEERAEDDDIENDKNCFKSH
jgi:hypothetical protein